MKALLVASSGGHLDQLFELAPRFLPLDAERAWVTPRNAHAESLLVDEHTIHVPAIGARQAIRAARALPAASRLLREQAPDVVISTGAALAVPYLIAARRQGVRIHYIDSATRRRGPSLTGKIARRLPATELNYQSAGWPPPWTAIASVFDGFSLADTVDRPVKSVVVTLGTERFPFTRAVEAIAAGLPPQVEVTWQLGHTPAPEGLVGERYDFMPYSDLGSRIAAADVVIAHAGVGSILACLRAGHRPIVYARRPDLGEHVDDHQLQLTAELQSAGVVISADEGPLSRLLTDAASRPVVRAADGTQ